MIQPWIHKKGTDLLFILSPTFLVIFCVVFFQNWLQEIETSSSFLIWLLIVVFIDVAHVYATLFKTYFNKEEFKKHKTRYIILPLFCLAISLVLFSIGRAFFWSVLAYVAVFHFIRQQYGFMRLYARNEKQNRSAKLVDNLMIYASTVYPMLYWFCTPKKNFNWFTDNEFFTFESPVLVRILTIAYVLIIAIYVIKIITEYIKNRYFNIPKNLLVLSTALSWYLGIVYYNNDLVFTLLNVVAHGIPYMALVFIKEQQQIKNNFESVLKWKLETKTIVFLFIATLLVIAFAEEFLWEVLVWEDHFSFFSDLDSSWQIIAVPLLTVPQFTHYLLDGFIWKRKK